MSQPCMICLLTSRVVMLSSASLEKIGQCRDLQAAPSPAASLQRLAGKTGTHKVRGMNTIHLRFPSSRSVRQLCLLQVLPLAFELLLHRLDAVLKLRSLVSPPSVAVQSSYTPFKDPRKRLCRTSQVLVVTDPSTSTS